MGDTVIAGCSAYTHPEARIAEVKRRAYDMALREHGVERVDKAKRLATVTIHSMYFWLMLEGDALDRAVAKYGV